jgi:mannose-1-phosphate guanylyltransferase
MVWATVLAGGSGRRLAEVTGGVPKQYWRLARGCTLLENTLGRIAPVVPPAQTVVVVDRTHEPYLEDLKRSRRAQLVYQPCDRGTAAGVLFGLMPALESASDPVVLLTPSDHGVVDTCEFRSTIRDALACVASDCRRIVLFGAEPSEANADYGWISPDVASLEGDTSGCWPVASFVEKPTPELAEKLLATSAVWNTMVVVAHTSALVDLYRRHLPDLMSVFRRAQCMPSDACGAFLGQQYPDLPMVDFCRDLLMPAEGLWVRMWPAALGWSDLGTPARFRRWIVNAQRLERGPVRIPAPPAGTDARIIATPAGVTS